MGGSLTALAPRVAGLSGHMGCPLTPEEIMDEFRSFYFDTALSTHETTLAAMNMLIAPERLLYGTDFPAVSVSMVKWFSQNLERHLDDKPEVLAKVLGANSEQLLA